MDATQSQGLSISDAFDQALADGQGQSQPPTEGSAEKPDNGSPDANAGTPQPEQKPKADVKVENKADVQPTPDNKQPPVVQPQINPDEGKYTGEYTKDRFDGLMSAWQKDRSLAKEVPTLKQEVERLKQLVENPEPKRATQPQDDELPPELQNADDDTKNGFRLLLKAQQGNLSKFEKKIVGNIMETLNRPLKEENEVVTKIQQEVEELSVKHGKNFSENVKEIKKFAADNNYPLGTLELAYSAWAKDKEISGLKAKMENGKKTVQEVEAENQKKGEIPHGNANRSG